MPGEPALRRLGEAQRKLTFSSYAEARKRRPSGRRFLEKPRSESFGVSSCGYQGVASVGETARETARAWR
jgi:hypothetical protein